ncbi:MAG: hypothetical protein GY757_17600, partial [bacterium]|nr:hypothetical protein [bacterium]
FSHFQQWAADSLENRRTAEAVKKLLREFFKSGDKELRNSLWDHVIHWKPPEGKEKQFKDFTDDVAKRFGS